MELLPEWNVILDTRRGTGLHRQEKSGFGADRFSIVGVVVLYGGKGRTYGTKATEMQTHGRSMWLR